MAFKKQASQQNASSLWNKLTILTNITGTWNAQKSPLYSGTRANSSRALKKIITKIFPSSTMGHQWALRDCDCEGSATSLNNTNFILCFILYYQTLCQVAHTFQATYKLVADADLSKQNVHLKKELNGSLWMERILEYTDFLKLPHSFFTQSISHILPSLN